MILRHRARDIHHSIAAATIGTMLSCELKFRKPLIAVRCFGGGLHAPEWKAIFDSRQLWRARRPSQRVATPESDLDIGSTFHGLVESHVCAIE